jgi:hypothetical protein
MSCQEDKVRAAQAAFAEATSCYNLGPGGERCWLSKNHTGAHSNEHNPGWQDQSTQPCGCDAGANHACAQHPDNYVKCHFSRDGYARCVREKDHPGRVHRTADGSLFVEMDR